MAADAAVSVAPPSWIAHPGAPFAVMATEVSAAQFASCVQAGACDQSTVNAKCNYGRPDKSDHPVNCVSFDGAEQYCVFAAGRLCSEQEWLAACRGSDGRAFPYGNVFDPSVCNSQSATETVEGRAVETLPVAALPGCEGGLPGLFDMAGNVAEWIADCKGSYCKFRGGGYLSNAPVERFTGCSSICSGNQKTLQSATVGFRCCQDR